MKRCVTCHKEYTDDGEFCPFDGGDLEPIVSDPLVGQILDGKYRIDKRINAGGMGTVYRGTHVLMDHVVAVKVMHDSMMTDPSAVSRFQREAKAAARIRHQNAVAVTDFGITPERVVYLVMELFDGLSLREVLDREGPLSLERTAYILDHAAAALQVAHDLGIVHRDIKPDNIMVRTTANGTEEVKVLDFGIAKLKDMSGGTEKLTNAGMVIGTPNYLSPEQCRAAELDARSDIYSLGIVAYELLSGAVPFTAPTPLAVAMMHTTEPPPSLVDKVADLPQDVEDVVFMALAKKADNRPQTAVEFAGRFTAAVYGFEYQPPEPSGTSRLSPAQEAARRRTTGALGPGTAQMRAQTGSQRARRESGAVTGEQQHHDHTSVMGGVSDGMGGTTGSGARVPSGQTPAPAPVGVAAAPAPTTAMVVPDSTGKKLPILPIALAGVVALGGAVAAVYHFAGPSRAENANAQLPSNANAVTPSAPKEAPANMVLVPTGTFKMGRDDAKDPAETPAHEVTVEAFYIDKHEVTNKEYSEFVRATSHRAPADWKDGAFPNGKGDYPVVSVSWEDARAYAEWAGKRLPTEAEWEYAARGTDGRIFPWGSDPRPDAAVSKEIGLKTPQPVESMPVGVSPFGAFDMYGNVWEWCENTFVPYPNSAYKMVDADKGNKMIRGGSFASEQSGKELTTVTTRSAQPPDFTDPRVGFRCAKSAE